MSNCSFHNKYDGSFWVNDARGIPLARVCAKCADKKLAKYRKDVITNPNYSADENIEENY
jgi:hypothetical protein